MSSTTPQPGSSSIKRSTSASRRPISRPSTPLRPSSRSSLRESGKSSVGGGISDAPIDAFEPAFAELSDSMADLEANFMHLQLMHESLARFSENFASFLYGLNMNAFCVDFPEAPIPESFKRAHNQDDDLGRSTNSERFRGEIDGETTFMTTDTSFVDNPPTSSNATSKFSTPAPSRIVGSSRGGGTPAARGGTARGGSREARGSGLARAAKGRTVR
ncbi:DASH complex component Dam1 [Amylocarpus encephaloides]|uniref:DASH complex subunit DAM1 n=1 Tax=Amylocarpus encephaloides TaxID=45428 RepID=A0A9P7YB49_9HELO|nr:DASH complex component Dam1 [Amylocarpus encephaloides]